MNRKITVTGANIVLFVFTVLFLIFQIILGILVVIYGENAVNEGVYKILLINEYIIILIPVLLYVLIKRLNFKEVFRFNKLGFLPGILIAIISIPAYMTALMLNNLVVYFLQFLGDIPNQPIPIPKNFSELVVGILIIAVSPAICEEMLHRGILLKAYEKRGSMKAVIITAILFGLFHYDFTNLFGPVFLGILIGYYVIKTNSIFAGMLAHFCNNAIAEVSQFSFRNRYTQSLEKTTVSTNELITIVLVGIVGLMLCITFVKLFNRTVRGKYLLKPSISSIKADIVSIISHWPIIIMLSVYFLMTCLLILSLLISKMNILN